MKNVLLVDDDSISNFINQRNLELTGLATDIQIAENGLAALQLFGKYYTDSLYPQLILLDINMPIMSGFEFIRGFDELEFFHKDKIRIVIMSSSENRKDVELAKALGVRYIVKPLVVNDLLMLLDESYPSV